jgi:Resolvase, N terminal domain
MKWAILYLRVSTLDQTTANQERELRQVAERAGWEVVHLNKAHGISGAKGKDKRLHSTRSARRPPAGSLMWWWLGRSIGSAEAFKTGSVSYPRFMPPASTCSCISRLSARTGRSVPEKGDWMPTAG